MTCLCTGGVCPNLCLSLSGGGGADVRGALDQGV